MVLLPIRQRSNDIVLNVICLFTQFSLVSSSNSHEPFALHEIFIVVFHSFHFNFVLLNMFLYLIIIDNLCNF